MVQLSRVASLRYFVRSHIKKVVSFILGCLLPQIFFTFDKGINFKSPRGVQTA